MPDDPSFLVPKTPRRKPAPNYDEIIERHTQGTGIDPDLVRAVMDRESRNKPGAVSPKGARGLMQLMPGTAARFGTTDIYDPDQNIRGGVRYLKFLNDRFKGDIDKVLAGYNAGEGAVDKFGGVPPYRETQNYVPAVKARYQELRESFLVPKSSSPSPMESGDSLPPHNLPDYKSGGSTTGYDRDKKYGFPPNASYAEKLRLVKRRLQNPTRQEQMQDQANREEWVRRERAAHPNLPDAEPSDSQDVPSFLVPKEIEEAPSFLVPTEQPSAPTDQVGAAPTPRQPIQRRVQARRQVRREPLQPQMSRADVARAYSERSKASMAGAQIGGAASVQTTPHNVPDINRILSDARKDNSPRTFAEDRAQRVAAQERERQARARLKQQAAPSPDEYKNFLLVNRAADSPQMKEQFLELQVKQATQGQSASDVLAGQQAERQRRQRVSQMGMGERAAQVPKSVVTGFAGGVGTSLKGVAALAKKLNIFGEYDGKETTDLATYKLGEAITNGAAEIVGSSPDLEQEFFVGKAPSTIGQVAQFMLGGWASKSPKLAVTILGSGMTAGDAYDEVRRRGGSDDEAVNAGLLAGAILGPTELIGMRGAMKALQGTAREATLKAAMKSAMKEGRRDIIENALQETGQEFGQGVITKNPRSGSELLEAAALGGIGGTATAPLTLAAKIPTETQRRLDGRERNLNRPEPADAVSRSVGAGEGLTPAGTPEPNMVTEQSTQRNVNRVSAADRNLSRSERTGRRLDGAGNINAGMADTNIRSDRADALNERAVEEAAPQTRTADPAGKVEEVGTLPRDPVAGVEQGNAGQTQVVVAHSRADIDGKVVVGSKGDKLIVADPNDPTNTSTIKNPNTTGNRNAALRRVPQSEVAKPEVSPTEVKEPLSSISGEKRQLGQSQELPSPPLEAQEVERPLAREIKQPEVSNESTSVADKTFPPSNQATGKAGLDPAEPVKPTPGDISSYPPHMQKILEKARQYDERTGVTIKDVTPEGFGPTGEKSDTRSMEPPHLTTEQSALRRTISEAETLLRGRMSPERRAGIQRSLDKARSNLEAITPQSEKDRQALVALGADQEIKAPPTAARKPELVNQEKPANPPAEQLPKEGARQSAPSSSRIEPITRSQKERATPKTLEKSGLEGGTDRLYDPVTNEESLAAADAILKQHGTDAAMAIASKTEASAEKTALGISLLRQLQTEGRHEDAINVASDLAAQLTKQGQAIQAVSIVSRLSPERQVLAAQAIVQKRTPNARLKPQQAQDITFHATKLEDAIARIATLEQRIEEIKLQPKVGVRKQRLQTLNDRLSKAEQDARARIAETKAKMEAGELQFRNAGPLPGHIATHLNDYAIIGSVKLVKQGVTFASWSADMTQEFGDAIKPHLRRLYRESYLYLQTERKTMRESSEQRLARKEIEGPVRSEDLNRLVEQRRQAQRDARAARYSLARTFNFLERGRSGQVKDAIVDVTNIPRTIMSSVDLSAPLRQGGFFTVTDPKVSAKAARDMVSAISERGYDKVLEEIKDHPDYKLGKRMGLEFTEVARDDFGLSHTEEAFLSKTAGKLPLVKHSQQAYTAFLDSQRMQVFSRLAGELRAQGKTPDSHPEAFKYIARFVNIGTGRASLGRRGNDWATKLSGVLFSPRYLASRFQLLNMMANPFSWAKMPEGARRIVMRRNMQFTGTVATVLGLAAAAGAKVTLDPDDADFLKIRIGDTRYDVLTGTQQPLRFMYRLGNAIRAGLTNDETYAGDSKGEVLTRFARSKEAPGFSFLHDYIAGQDYMGRKFDLADRSANNPIVSRVLPMFLKDTYEAMQEEGLIGAVKTTPAFFGLGVQTYPSPPEQATTKAEKLTRAMIRRRMPDEARTQEEIDKSKKVSDLRARSRRGEDVSGQLGGLSARQQTAITNAKDFTRLQEDFKKLPIKDALTVYGTMTRGEQASVKPILETKSEKIDELPEDDQAVIKQKLEAIGMRPGVRRRERREREARKPRGSSQGYVFQ